MKKWIAMMAWLLVGTIAIAQTYTTKNTANDRLKKSYDKAMDFLTFQQYEPALAELNKILKADDTFIDAQIAWADTQHDLGALTEAETGYKKALTIANDYSANVLYKLGLTLIKLEKYTEAESYLNQFVQSNANEKTKAKAQVYLSKVKFAAEAIKKPVPFKPAKLNENVNTAGAEYLPSLTAEGQFLVYTAVINGQEDFYLSEKINGTWQKGTPIQTINTPENEGAQNISADGKSLVFTGCNREGGLGRCDIFYAISSNGKWTRPRNMGAPINSKAWEAQPSLSSDGNTIYFSSDRTGGAGGKDLWVSSRQANGLWSNPQNLSSNINTTSDEETPFIHPDGQTLYFMSDGHPGMGGSDLFVARRKADGTWDTPKNLGYPINTSANEGGLVVSLDGTTAYFATDEATLQKDRSAARHKNNIDIFSFDLYPAARPNPVTYVKAKVIDANTKVPLVANVEFTDVKTGTNYASSKTDVDGTFLVCLPMGKDYALNVSKEKYLFHSENFALAAQKSLQEPFLLEIELIPISESVADGTPVKSKPIVLKNVFFETGSASLRPESKNELNRLKQLLTQNPTLKIRINGHTDNVGADKDNLSLSDKRAKAVYDFLIQQGIVATRLSYKGFGESQAIDTNDTPQGKQKNRRTEFEVTQ